MGYRSDVTAIIYAVHRPFGKDAEVLAVDKETRYSLLKTVMNTTFKDLINMWGSHFDWQDATGVLVFTAGSIKWYESDPDIQHLESFFREISRLGFSYEFVRIGENQGDVEEHSSYNSMGFLHVETVARIDL